MAECSREHSAILLTFIKLSFVIKIFVLSSSQATNRSWNIVQVNKETTAKRWENHFT